MSAVLRIPFGCLFALALTAPLQAKPLISNSEDTAAALCRAVDPNPERQIALCEAALQEQLTPAERSVMLNGLGDAYYELDRYDEAEAQYRLSSAADPQNIDPMNGLGWVYWIQDREAEAAAHFQASVDWRPSAQGLAGLGSSLFRSGAADMDAAMEYLDAALAIDPDYLWALREKGWVALNSGAPDPAVAAFEAAVERDSEDWNAHYGLSRALGDLGAFERALTAINVAVVLDPTAGWGYAQRAYILRRLDRNAQAVTEADRVIEILPQDSEGYTQRALALQSLGRRAEALATFEAALAAGAEDGFLLYWYADVLSNDGRMEDAMGVIDRAIALQGDDPADHALRAYIAMEMRAFEKSLASAERALELNPAHAYAHYYAAVALAHAGAVEDAMDRFKKAIDLGLNRDMVSVFAADLISAGRFRAALQLRKRY
ncbi:MAG: tetratricopeptide repeat protein [Pseudomonadota bacterium]